MDFYLRIFNLLLSSTFSGHCLALHGRQNKRILSPGKKAEKKSK